MIPQTNDFTTFDFTDEELVEAAKLTILQKAYLQHQIGVLSTEKVQMKFDPLKPAEFMQNEAYVSGQIEAFKSIISNAEVLAEDLRNNLKEQQHEAAQRARGIYQKIEGPLDNPNSQVFE